MKKFFVVALAVIAIAALPGLVAAQSVSYLQGQQNQVVTGGSQGQVYIGFAGQGQAGVQSSLQGQASANTASVKIFGITVKQVDANGANSQGQGSSYVQQQGGAGLTIGAQRQGTVQSQGQFQLSGGSAN